MVIFVTGNANKLREFKQIIGDIPVENKSIDLTEIQGSVEEVCIAKSREASKISGLNINSRTNNCGRHLLVF